jgi:hypothetical protein
MKFAPKVAVSVALVSVLFNSMSSSWAAAPEALPAGSQDTRVTIDAHIGRLESAIDSGVAGGRLTTEEADNYRSALGQIAEEKAQYVAAAGQIGPAMQTRLQTALARIEKRLDTTQHDRRIAIFDFGAAEDSIRAAINAAQSERRLSADSVNHLQAELKSIDELQQALRNDGIISYGDALIVSFHLDRLVDHLGGALAEPTNNSISTDEIANLTSVALSNAKIAPDQGNAWRKQFDELQQQLSNAKNIKSPVQKANQLLFLASQFELLKARIDLAAAGKSVAFAPRDRVQQIDFAIADAFGNGKLTPAEAHELRAELQGVIAEMGTETALPPEKANRIALELERINGHMQRWQHQPQKTWPGFDAFQAAFDQRLEDSTKANRLTPEQQAKYKAEADQIAKVEATKRALHNGQLETNDALDLAIQLQRLSVALHHDKKDRDLTPPDIDALQAELDRVIVDGISSGRLAADGSLLTERLNHVAELRSNYQKSSEGLDARARLAIADSIAQTIANIQQEMHHDVPGNQPLDLRLDKLGDLLSNAVASGLISIERGTQYRAAVDTIYSRLSTARKSDAGLSAPESIAIANDVDLLTAQGQDELRESAVFAINVSNEIDELHALIGNALANGRLTIGQANDLVADLDRKSAAINTAMGAQGGLSHGEGMKFAFDVQRIKSKYETGLHDNAVPIADVGERALSLDTNLANALAAGQLTVPQAQQYKNSLEQIMGTAEQFRETDGGLTMPESIALGLEMDQLGRIVDTGVRKGTEDRNVDSRQNTLKKRIAQMAAAGKISQKDADALSYDLDRIEESEAAFRVSEEGLNYAEALTLTLDLDRLSTKIDSMSR